MDALADARAALRATERPGGCQYTLGDPRPDQRCHLCGQDTAIVADVLRLGDDGPRAIATMRHCPDCDTRETD